MENVTGSEFEVSEDLLQEVANYEQISCLMAWSTLSFCLLGICSNVLSALIFAQPSMRRTPINLLLFGMSCVDICLCILAIFVFTVPEFYACYRTSLSLLLSTYAFAYIYPLTSSAQTASIWLFLVVSYERWNAVCGGASGRMYQAAGGGGVRNANRHRQRRNAAISVILVSILSLGYNLVRFFEFRVVSEHDPTADITSLALENVLKNEDHPSYRIYMNVYYIALFLLTHFAGPFFAMVIVNGMILKTIYVARQRRRQLLTRKEEKEHRTSFMMVIVILMFLACHTPAFILNVIESIDPSWFYGTNVAFAFALNDISNFFIVANAATGAIIYYHFNKSYHDVCSTLFSKRHRQRRRLQSMASEDESRINGTGTCVLDVMM